MENNVSTKTSQKKKTSVTGLTKNIVQFRNGFVNLHDSKETNYEMAMSVASELMQFGYILGQDAITQIASASKEEIVRFHDEVIDWLKEMTGSKRNYQPFWKGFPQEVMEKSECELWMHQIIYYWSNCKYDPSDWTKTKPTAFEQPKYTRIVVGNDEKFISIFTNLVSINQSLTPDDMNVVKFFVENGHPLVFPQVIPFKENLCYTITLMIESDKYEFI